MASMAFHSSEFSLLHAINAGHALLANQPAGSQLRIIRHNDTADIVVDLQVRTDWTIEEKITAVLHESGRVEEVCYQAKDYKKTEG